MRGFMILCLVAVTIAAPQYNYHAGTIGGSGAGQQGGFAGQGGTGGGFAGQGSTGGSFAGPGATSGSFAGQGAGGGGFAGQGTTSGGFSGQGGAVGGFAGQGGVVGGFAGQGATGGDFSGEGATGGGFGGQGAGNFGQAIGVAPSFGGGHQVAPVQAIYNKQFFIHSAPEEDSLSGVGSVDEQATLRKNLRVVIVKAPENKGLTNAALQLAKSASEDKTVVYVLNKQTDLGELQSQLSQIQESNPNKPEVHFVKYKTPEEAEHAQHSIQAQYDSFGGPTQVSDEGIAPVQSFIGSAGQNVIGAGNGGNGFFGSSSQFGSPSVQNTYLPSPQRF